MSLRKRVDLVDPQGFPVPKVDAAGNPIPYWKRKWMAKGCPRAFKAGQRVQERYSLCVGTVLVNGRKFVKIRLDAVNHEFMVSPEQEILVPKAQAADRLIRLQEG